MGDYFGIPAGAAMFSLLKQNQTCLAFIFLWMVIKWDLFFWISSELCSFKCRMGHCNIIYTASSAGLSTVSLFPSLFTRYLNWQ